MIENIDNDANGKRQEYRNRRNPQYGDHCENEGLSDQRFPGVVSNGRATIDVEIGMMHLVEAPEQWNRMREPMQCVLTAIQHDDADQQRRGQRYCNSVEQTPVVLTSQHCQRDCSQRHT